MPPFSATLKLPRCFLRIQLHLVYHSRLFEWYCCCLCSIVKQTYLLCHLNSTINRAQIFHVPYIPYHLPIKLAFLSSFYTSIDRSIHIYSEHMDTGIVSPIRFLSLVWLAFIVCSTSTQARPFNILRSDAPVRGDLSNGLYLDLGAIKNSGPSPGEGHKYTNHQTLGGIKDAGRGIFQGHKFANAQTLGSIKEGPSPGQGHKFSNVQTLGGIKEGPSPGQGHRYINGQTLGGIKEGPSPGEGHKHINTQTLGGIKDGPSPGEGHNLVNGKHH